MATRVVEGKKLWTGGTAITVDQLNKVISLNLRDENNLIMYDVGDDEIYVDLQLGDEIRPTSDFPVGVTTGRAITDNGWGMTGTILVAKTTSGDNIKLFYCDDGKLYIDNGTGSFTQIYLKPEVDALLLALRQYVDGELAKKQDLLTAGDNITIEQVGDDLVISADDTTYTAGDGISIDENNEISSVAIAVLEEPSAPIEGQLWYDTTDLVLKIYDGTTWQII